MRTPSPASGRIVSAPPSASTRSRSASSCAADGRCAPDDLEDERPGVLSHGDRRPRAAGLRERLEPAGVHRVQDLGRTARAGGDLDRGRDAGAHRGGAKRGGEAELEQRQVDPLREVRRLVEASCTSRPISSRSAFAAAGSESSADSASWSLHGERDQVLLHAAVQLALDLGGGRHRRRGRAVPATRAARRAPRADARSHRDQPARPPFRSWVGGSCPRSRARRQAEKPVSARRAATGSFTCCRRSRAASPSLASIRCRAS